MLFDVNYLILVLPAVIFAGFCSLRVRSVYARYAEERSRGGMTGASAARRILDRNGLHSVAVERAPGKLTDHFDPRENVVRLSQGVFDGASTAAVGIAAHEAGHALQYAAEYGPIKLRAAIIPVTQVGSRLAMPLVLIGLAFGHLGQLVASLAYAGVLLFGLSTVFQLVTLPVEFNASRRAMQSIESEGLLLPEERRGARKVLSAAALTYVAALFTSLMQLLWLLTLVSGRSSRRR